MLRGIKGVFTQPPEKADVEINAKGRFGREARGLLRCCERTLRLRRFSTLNDLLLAHSPYPTTDADAVFFGPDTYLFCKLISDAIKTAVDIGCGSGAGGTRFYSA